MNIPNFITFLRIVSVPLIVWLLLEGNLVSAFWIFSVAAISDALDGFIAKRFNMETELGKYLDPLADKALLMAVFITLGFSEIIPNWVVILVVFRDIVIIVGALVFDTLTGSLTRHPMKPQMISKINTTLQLLYSGSVMAVTGYEIDFGIFVDLLMMLMVVTTVISGITIVTEALKRWSDDERI
ncbi:MAG: CDP-alcohol phosphatidyltransferase family protein [Rhodospirillaceae bacterium]|nr:CDP-alcohol phosphatidyltransferase family protein [Rhodospirillaceae bacterium]